MKELRFFVFTDPHFFKNALGAYGEEYEAFMDGEQKCFAETEAISRAVLDDLAGRDEADIVLIAGDLSFDGEKESHEEFSRLLHAFQEKSGKRVYVVTAGHDMNETPRIFTDAGLGRTQGTKFDELYDYYRDFGYDEAIAFNREHLSYVVDLSEDVRLLVICNDTAEGKHRTYDDEFLRWIETQAKTAQQDGKMMIAMEHYPVLPGQPVFALIGDARQPQSEKLIDTLADNGVHLIFTGHMHNQSVNVVQTAKGNKFYDVCTGAVIGCPAFMRLVTVIDRDTVRLESIPIPEFDWDKKGMAGEEYLRVQFGRMIRTYIDCMENDPQRFMRKVRIKPSPVLEKIFRRVGRKLSRMTVGQFTRLLFVRADDAVKNERFVDFAVDLVRSIFEGNQPYVEGTPAGDTLLRVFRRLRPFFKNLKGTDGEPLDFYETFKHTVGNYGIDDYNAVLKF